METEEKKSIKRIFSFRSFLFGIIFAIIVYLVIAIFSGWEDLVSYLLQINPVIVIFAILLSFTNYFFRFLKWHIFTESLNLNIPFKDNFIVFIAGLSLSITPAKVGEAIRAFLLQKSSSIDLSKGLASTFSERLIDLLAVTILALIGIIFIRLNQSNEYLPLLIFILIGIIFAVLIFLFDSFYSVISWIFRLKPWKRFGEKIDSFRYNVVVTLNYRVFFSALILGIIGWACEGIGFLLIANDLGISITFETSIFIYATSSLLGALSFLPGGLGVTEGSMEIFLANLLTIDSALAGALIILIRMTTLWFGIALGLLFLLLASRRINIINVHD